MLLLRKGSVVRSPISGRAYRVGSVLGEGGFGAAYQATRVDGDEICVLKVTGHAVSWHRESYFGFLLSASPGLVRVIESFVWLRSGAPLYCLISEFMEGGDVGSYLERHPEPWPEKHARREIIRLLRAVTLLHDSGAVHRDITPGNVFVTGRRTLKLGDFGIAMHRVGRHEVAADAFTPRFAPAPIRQRKTKSWRQADDVHQIAQLYAALLQGAGTRKFTAAEVKNFSCSPHAKSILQRCIGERRKCFESATEMLKALENAESTARAARVNSLSGKHVVFTGPLSLLRAEAKRLAKRAGAIVEDRVNQLTDVLIVGGPSPQWKAELKGQKLLDVDREKERGHEIAVVREKRFLALVGRKKQ